MEIMIKSPALRTAPPCSLSLEMRDKGSDGMGNEEADGKWSRNGAKNRAGDETLNKRKELRNRFRK